MEYRNGFIFVSGSRMQKFDAKIHKDWAFERELLLT
jgi:hypothetical protein